MGKRRKTNAGATAGKIGARALKKKKKPVRKWREFRALITHYFCNSFRERKRGMLFRGG